MRMQNIMKMKQHIQLLIILMTLFLVGCTIRYPFNATQGRLTYLTMNDPDSTLEEMQVSMEELKYQGYEGSTKQQFSALKEARYISKYMDGLPEDQIKREMAVSALVFLAFSSDDWEVQDRSRNRVEILLDDGEAGSFFDFWPLFLEKAAVDGIADYVIGSLGYSEEHDGQPMTFGVKTGWRSDALEVLLDSFDDQHEELQYHTVSALHRILKAPPDLDTCPFNICDEDVRKNREEWDLGKEEKQVLPSNADQTAVESGAYGPESKRVPIDERQEWQEESGELKQQIWKALEDLLEDSDISLLNRSRIVRWSGEVRTFSLLPDMEQSFQETMADWAENEDIPSELRQLLKAGQERVVLYEASTKPVPSESSLSRLWMHSSEFVETHLEAILAHQQSRQKSGYAAGIPDLGKLITASYGDSPQDRIKREIILDHVGTALHNGLLAENMDFLAGFTPLVQGAPTESELAPMIKVAAGIYPSLKQRNVDPQPLLDMLVRGVENSEDFSRKRLYLRALSAGIREFPEAASLGISTVTLDRLTRQQVEASVQKINETL